MDKEAVVKDHMAIVRALVMLTVMAFVTSLETLLALADLATALVAEHLSTKTAMVFVMSVVVLVLKMELACVMAEEPVNHPHLLKKDPIITDDYWVFLNLYNSIS
jgi:uncharacterized Zn-finger protein